MAGNKEARDLARLVFDDRIWMEEGPSDVIDFVSMGIYGINEWISPYFFWKEFWNPLYGTKK